jgi:hypothetical protein
MSLRPHFIKISDVLVRGIARSTVKREMLRSLRHIAETIDAVMIAEGIEHLEDVVALRDLGLRYGQGYYMARPGQGFPTIPDDVRGELRNVMVNAPASALASALATSDDEDDDDDRDLTIASAPGAPLRAMPRNLFGRVDDEITSDFQIPGIPGIDDRIGPRGSQAQVRIEPVSQPSPAWRPLVDDEGGASPEAEPLLDSLRRTRAESSSDDERGGGRPGLN